MSFLNLKILFVKLKIEILLYFSVVKYNLSLIIAIKWLTKSREYSSGPTTAAPLTVTRYSTAVYTIYTRINFQCILEQTKLSLL